MDISGPHTSGRWPSDAPEAWAKRAMYFVVGAFKTYTEDEINEIAKNRLAAADASGFTTTEDPLNVIEEKGMLYYVRPHRGEEQCGDDQCAAGHRQ